MRKTLYIIVLLITVMSLLTVNVNAADDLTFITTLKASNTSVEAGKEFTVKISVDKFDAAEKGINAFSAVLEYDSNVFETLVTDNISGSNDWKVKYDESNGKLTLTKARFATTKQDIGEFKFKVKSDVDVGKKGKIVLTNITSSDSGEKELTAEDVTLEIEVSDAKTNTENTTSIIRTIPDNTNTNTENTNTVRNIVENTNTNSNTSNYTNQTNQTKEDKMPNTGLDDSIVKAMILVALVGVFGYIKFKSLDK